MPEGGTLVLLIITLCIHHLLHHRPTEDLNCFDQYFMVIYHIVCSNMFVFACPIGYLHSRSIFAPAFNFRYLRSGFKDYVKVQGKMWDLIWEFLDDTRTDIENIMFLHISLNILTSFYELWLVYTKRYSYMCISTCQVGECPI
jgi:hypothetical protein